MVSTVAEYEGTRQRGGHSTTRKYSTGGPAASVGGCWRSLSDGREGPITRTCTGGENGDETRGWGAVEICYSVVWLRADMESGVRIDADTVWVGVCVGYLDAEGYDDGGGRILGGTCLSRTQSLDMSHKITLDALLT